MARKNFAIVELPSGLHVAIAEGADNRDALVSYAREQHPGGSISQEAASRRYVLNTSDGRTLRAEAI